MLRILDLVHPDPDPLPLPPPGTAPGSLEKCDKSSPNLSATETVDIEVACKIEQFKIVCHRSEYLEGWVLLQLD